MSANKHLSLLSAVIVAFSCVCIAQEAMHTFKERYVIKANPVLPISKCHRKPLVIAVIDTGFGYQNRGHGAHLCRFGHRDFTTDQVYDPSFGTNDAVPMDIHGHGTNIVGIIDREADQGTMPYCFVILKYYKAKGRDSENLFASIAAINYARQIHADYINYSGGGLAKYDEETAAVKQFLDAGGKFIAAAGNDNLLLDNKNISYYPAMADSRTIVVGNQRKDGKISRTSNWGDPVNRWEVGEDVSAYDITLTGTSQATAVATGKIVAETERKCH